VNDNLKVYTSNIEKLVKASQGRDRRSFDEIVRLYQRRAMQIAVRIIGDANEAAEAVQNGFFKAYLSIGKLREPKRFEAWFFRIITNTAISQRRAAKYRREKLKMEDCYKAKKAHSPVESQIGKELKEAIQRAMLKLSKKEAKAIAMFGIEDLPREKVAEIMGCSVEAVRWHVFRARQKLRVLLKDYLE
jgi:RNA polymerase sigma-70 factor (ECF subfamily)